MGLSATAPLPYGEGAPYRVQGRERRYCLAEGSLGSAVKPPIFMVAEPRVALGPYAAGLPLGAPKAQGRAARVDSSGGSPRLRARRRPALRGAPAERLGEKELDTFGFF